MLKKALCLAALAAGCSAMPAQAAQYMFSFTTNEVLLGNPSGVIGSGIFTTSDTAMTIGGQTAFAITGITGSVNGLAITTPVLASYGNYFTTGPNFLDGSGVKFNLTGGGRVDFFNQSSNGRYRVNSFSPGGSYYVTATSSPVAAVPEPTSWAMFIGGFALLGTAAGRLLVRYVEPP
jgi:hypothetical protein